MTNIQERITEVDPSGMSLYQSAVSLSPAAVVSLGSMEGVPDRPGSKPAAPALPAPVIGIALAVLVTGAAYLLHQLPVWPFAIAGKHPISATLLAIVLGVLIRNLVTLPESISVGTKMLVKRLIPIAIVCIGAGLNFGQLRGAGPLALGVMVVCVIVGYGATVFIGRLLGLPNKTAVLLGVGTGICGSSAIVAAAPLIDAEDEDVVLSVGTVNLLGLVAMLALPAIASAVGMAAQAFGIWCGCTIHAVPQVLGAGDGHYADPTLAVEWATLIKLARVVLLAPLMLVLAIAYARRRKPDSDAPKVHPTRLIPWYIWGFIALALLNTLGWLPTMTFAFGQSSSAPTTQLALAESLTTAGKFLLVLALAGIGLEVRLRKLIAVGSRAIGAGLISTVVLALVAYLLILVVLG